MEKHKVDIARINTAKIKLLSNEQKLCLFKTI